MASPPDHLRNEGVNGHAPATLIPHGEVRGAVVDLSIFGLGPVGLVTALAFAKEGHRVAGIDVDQDRVSRIARGEAPFCEEGLEKALHEALDAGHFTATVDSGKAADAEIVFICVNTPSRPDGSMDDSFLRQATKDIADAISTKARTIVAVKSTIIPGTTENVVRPILEASGKAYGLAVNPEFLREGHALEDALEPDRVILGVDGPDTARRLGSLYAHLDCPIIETDLRTAEAIKYATNAFLATKVAFANELANICQALEVSYDEVIQGVILDPRIDPRFLVPGVGFGGSCFPKDVKALVAVGKAAGHAPRLLEAVLDQNDEQYLQAIKLLEEELGDLKDRRIALLGLAFKGGTDDVRESRAIPIAESLLQKGAKVVGYDPVANENFANIVPDVTLAENLEEALRGADDCILQADWPEFSRLSAQDFLQAMHTPVVVDGRRILDPKRMKGVRFRRIG